ncbi:MAG: vacuolar iron transporter family protein [Nocardioidaceae bacterium]|jgi:VIT1/CCC1 family predicted Fe2+/Mn2+ transporter|nr:vacuolar iron transporter family protein [Nocardioidaceae bacterium]
MTEQKPVTHPATEPMAPSDQVMHEHGDVTSGWLRPAVFGAMDGLVSNFALMAGVVGGTSGGHSSAVVLAGLAGLAAGAFSMAAGEYTSVASQEEYTRAEIEVERREISLRPAAEEAELAQMYVDRGISPELAAAMAAQIHLDPELAVEVHTREELGVDPDNLPSPMVAAGSSFVSFAVGALLPVLPYLLGAHTILPALVVSLLALFGCGALVSRVTTRSWWYGGLRQLLLGGTAAGLTFLIGDVVGTAIG